MSEVLEAKERLDLLSLKAKMKLEGRVTSVEPFGAFVDVGAEREGLIHISQISGDRINRVADVLKDGDSVTVWVQSVDLGQGRIDLTMIEPPGRAIADLRPDQVLTGTVTKLAPYGAFVDIGVERDGLIHISEMAEGHTATPSEVVQVGDEIRVRVVKVNRSKRRIGLSLLEISGNENREDVEEANEEEPLTAMEMAWQNAMERRGMSLKVPTRKRGRRRRKSEIRRHQASIIARTLRAKKD